MSIQYNPFKENRTEQMQDLWKYYVPFTGVLNNAGKPIVVEGGRGSGKTMFFKCNSWRERLAEIKKNEHCLVDLFDENKFIGIYYRVDTTFVSSMNGREVNWNSIFQTYFSICILKELLELIDSIKHELNIDEHKLSMFLKMFSEKLSPESAIDNISDFIRHTNKCLDHIEDIVNGEDFVNTKMLRFVMANRFINDVCIEFNKLINKNIIYKIFIDEYETLQLGQQKIVNTLIKHSTIPVIFNIGLRPKGMKTNKAISETEIIEAPHDYEEIVFRIESSEYKKILKEICAKRIILGKEKKEIPEYVSEDIEFYLDQYSFEYEVKKLENTIGVNKFLIELRELIKRRSAEEGETIEKINQYISVLCDRASLLNARLHYALLCVKTMHTLQFQNFLMHINLIPKGIKNGYIIEK